jgi:hypothetical protein
MKGWGGSRNVQIHGAGSTTEAGHVLPASIREYTCNGSQCPGCVVNYQSKASMVIKVYT